MHTARGLFGSLIVGGAIAVTVFGALILSLRGTVAGLAELPIPTVTFQLVFETATPTRQPPASLVAVISQTPIGAPAGTSTGSPTPTVCPAPAEWQRYIVGPFDTFDSIAQRFNLTPDQLQQANCLPEKVVTVAQSIYVPPFRPTPTPIPCRPPVGWVVYIVRYGDTLSSIAARYGMSLYTLMAANCLNTVYIYAGQPLRVPWLLPVVTLPQPTFTSTPIIPTGTPTPTPPIVTLTPTVIPPTDVTPVITDTPAPTETPVPGDTPTPPISTDTPAPTPAPTVPPPDTATPAPPPTELPPPTEPPPATSAATPTA
jgi:LysM repeat protein